MRHFGLIILTTISLSAWAQGDADIAETPEASSTDTEVEALYDKLDDGTQVGRPAPAKPNQERPDAKVSEKEIKNLTELGTLEPFKDIAVIQRRFLPRTQRFDVSGNAMVTLNNPFFNNMGLALRGAYHFTESMAAELQYFYLDSQERQVTEGLRDRLIQTNSLVTAKSYMGGAFKWSPIYGKVTFLNQQIIPFDLHFTAGLGLTETDERSGEATFHIGTGQAFAWTKSMAFRWDFVWNFYSAQAVDKNNQKITTNHNDLFISAGVSFLFPEAGYR